MIRFYRLPRALILILIGLILGFVLGKFSYTSSDTIILSIAVSLTLLVFMRNLRWI